MVVYGTNNSIFSEKPIEIAEKLPHVASPEAAQRCDVGLMLL